MGTPPQVNTKEVLAYRADARRVLAEADPARMKRLLRLWVKEVRLEPRRHTVHIWYRVPYLQIAVAGAGFVAEEKTRTRRWIVETAFRVPGKVVETVSRRCRLHKIAPDQASKPPKVAGW